MMRRDRGPIRLLVLGAILVAGGCNHTTGPSLSAVVTSEKLVPTVTLPQIVNVTLPTLPSPFPSPADPASLCCCRVVGTIQNTSVVPVNINIFFHATTTDGQCPGIESETQAGCTGQDSLVAVEPGATANYSAAGILKPCDLVSSVAVDVALTGIWFPSSTP